MNKRELDRLKRQRAEQESKAGSESERRGEKITVVWRELRQHFAKPSDAVKELANSDLGKALLELLTLLQCEIEELTQDQQVVEEIHQHFPTEWDKLRAAIASVRLDKIAAAVLPRVKLSPKQAKEGERRRQFASGGVGLIEFEFGGELEAWWHKELLLFPFWPHFQTFGPTCLDNIFIKGAVSMKRLEDLFWRHRSRFGKLPIITNGRDKLYDYQAVLLIMERLLNEKRSATKTRGRRLRIWLSDPDGRFRVLRAIEARVNSFQMPRQIRLAFLTLLHRHMPDSAKK